MYQRAVLCRNHCTQQGREHRHHRAQGAGLASHVIICLMQSIHIGACCIQEKDPAEERRKTEQEEEAGVEKVDVFGMRLKAIDVDGEMHSIETDGKPIDPAKVDKYFERAFGARWVTRHDPDAKLILGNV